MFFNTHTHLNSEELFDKRDLYIRNALEYSVDNMVVVGYDIETSKKAVQIAHEYSFIQATVGIGPDDCLNTTDDDLKVIEELLQDSKVVAVGEVGLEYHWDDVPKEKQKEVFQKQIDLAKKYHKPLVIHSRDAAGDMYDMLSQAKHFGVMHCYSGSVEMAKRFIDIGFMISLAGPVTFKNARVPKAVAKEIDIEHLLIETDDPFLTPEPFRGKQNEPANVVYVANEIAKIKSMDIRDVGKITTNNAKKIFNIK